jgi:hypothetical protein
VKLEPKVEVFSELYCRYNGLMLGTFLGISRFKFAKRRYTFHRQRMQQFLGELGIDFSLPLDHKDHLANRDATFKQLATLLYQRSPRLADFVVLGVTLIDWAVGIDRDEPTLKKWVPELLEEHRIPKVAVKRLLASVPRGLDWTPIDDILSPMLTFVRETVRPIPVESDTCFVAMPFRPPFNERFETFYRPALENSGLRCFRAWGGLSGEDYCEMLIELIRHSGAVLADLTGLNPNVVYEIGVAHGLGKTVFLIREEAGKRHRVFSNISYDAVWNYPTTEEFRDERVLGAGVYLAAVRLAAEQSGSARVRA